MLCRWRSHCVGAVSAVSLGAAVDRGGKMIAASGWRSATAAETPSWLYDQDRVYAGLAERYPEAAVVVTPRTAAVPSETDETEPTQRDRHLQHIAEHGRMG